MVPPTCFPDQHRRRAARLQHAADLIDVGRGHKHCQISLRGAELIWQSSASCSSDASTEPSTSLVTNSRSSTRTVLLSIKALSSEAISPEKSAWPDRNATTM
jgi:hypothetical protein